ncbi:MAG: methylenetetrahydrofolate--tRNA-(uracil(54)-C(5))-methyltransferase (FADH(2)-oxidizing) TrmFO [Angelakisella sp.]|jgi:methylenetetrahydrofolate--tRNA-(uracil-5-)-methyltransferase|nr:methylenetetrahydrofolate--tRNA-(uracil(54)-C(5))-methyltransferase (FADH(2)-oxidizing) TrmFO [Angelakisella sp.]
MRDATVIGGGLAGCEAAWALVNAGHRVTLYEMKPEKYSPAHKSPGLAELVCSNSFKSTRPISAAGLLKEEMALLGSLTLEAAKETAVSAGGALAVDRDLFSAAVTRRVLAHPGIRVVTGQEVTQVPGEDAVVATGPLTSPAMSNAIGALCGERYLSFYDASAPIVEYDTIDHERTFFATRYGRGEADYINCPFSQPEYDAFYDALVSAQSVELKPFEREYFKVYEGCMPIEVMAARGRDTLRFGPMRPVGIQVPWTGHRPWANIQLRKDNAGGTLYNIVGFQTNLTFPEQQRVFRMIPGLQNARFARYGVMHRNTFLDSPRLLDGCFALKGRESLFFAGQLTGVEGYMESAASGIVAGRALARRLAGKEPRPLPVDTMLGALCHYISDPTVTDFQPMGSNMGILPPLAERERNKELRYTKMAERAISSLRRYLEEESV